MATWVDRVGKHGEHQAEFLNTSHIYLTWGLLQDHDLTHVTFPELRVVISKSSPNASTAKISNHGSQVSAFVNKMKVGDLVISPLADKAAVAIGEITGPYRYDASGKHMYRHSHAVKWLSIDVPRSRFDEDIRHALSGMKTIFEIKSRDVDRRVREMLGLAAAGTHAVAAAEERVNDDIALVSEGEIDFERRAYDDIAQLILRKFKGHGLERLVEGILIAQGYATYRSPVGPDKGVDLLAAPGPLGFGTPRICVQVKCTESPIDHPTLQQLLGTMQSVKADQGLLISWGGFKSSVDKVRADHFFKVRLWDQDDLIRELLANYDRLDQDLRAELPLKRIWIASTPEDM